MIFTQETGNIWVQIGILLVCIALFVGTYLLNRHTKKPRRGEKISQHSTECTVPCETNHLHTRIEKTVY